MKRFEGIKHDRWDDGRMTLRTGDEDVRMNRLLAGYELGASLVLTVEPSADHAARLAALHIVCGAARVLAERAQQTGRTPSAAATILAAIATVREAEGL